MNVDRKILIGLVFITIIVLIFCAKGILEEVADWIGKVQET